MEIGGEPRFTRFTRDIDLAVLATDHQHYEKLRQYFVEQEGFTLSPRFELSLFTPQGTPVDLLPFGPIEENHEVQIGGMAKAAQVHGFQEACEQAVSVQYQDQGICQVITAGGLMLLKFIALDDRPHQRANDVDDLSLFLRLAYSLFLEEIQAHHWDLLDHYPADNHFDLQVGGHYLGRALSQTIGPSESLRPRLTHIIRSHRSAHPQGALSRALIHQQGLSAAGAQLSLAALQRGMEE